MPLPLQLAHTTKCANQPEVLKKTLAPCLPPSDAVASRNIGEFTLDIIQFFVLSISVDNRCWNTYLNVQ